jgi:hypothetical protein
MEVQRIKLSPDAKKIYDKFCENNEIHSELNVTYKDVADRVISWLYKQPVEIWNEVIKIYEKELYASEDKCFTGRLSRLVSCLDGFHPDVRISIATSDQISNRVLGIINKFKEEHGETFSHSKLDDLILKITNELKELEMTEEQISEWLVTVKDTIDVKES